MMDRFIVTLAFLAMACSAAVQAQSPAMPPGKALPEITARLPTGEYAGTARQDKALDVSLSIHESKAGGRFTGTVVVHQAAAPCNARFPLSGEIRPDGAVRIDSREGVAPGCERHFDLMLAGNDLTGTMTATGNTFQVKLKRRTLEGS